jgi:hypothetical protein
VGTFLPFFYEDKGELSLCPRKLFFKKEKMETAIHSRRIFLFGHHQDHPGNFQNRTNAGYTETIFRRWAMAAISYRLKFSNFYHPMFASSSSNFTSMELMAS